MAKYPSNPEGGLSNPTGQLREQTWGDTWALAPPMQLLVTLVVTYEVHRLHWEKNRFFYEMHYEVIRMMISMLSYSLHCGVVVCERQHRVITSDKLL